MNRWIFGCFASLLALCCVTILAFRWAAYLRETVPFSVGLPPEGQLIETAQGDIFTVDVAKQSAPRVVFAHGTAAWSAIWRETMLSVSNAGYQATAFDMPPFGWSKHPDGADYSRSAQADRVIALLEALDDRPIIVAHSVGAGPVSEAVLKRPELVSGYIVVSGAIGLSDRGNPKQPPHLLRNSTIRELATSITATNPMLTGTFLRDFMYRKEAATPELIDMLRAPMVREGYTNAVSKWVPELFTTPRDALSLDPTNWEALDLPFAVIWGAEDKVTPISQGKELATLVPNAKLTILESVGHIPHLEAPPEFAEALIDALKSMAPPHTQELEQQ
ncbi:alpha/beta hydrolase [Shimia sp. R9_1]|uniref:alpha/beta fold hydrolase n=1 Tax=Shimia sp. R9_1 TaxID=2821111 RepID=UPI001ADBE907|nr:alpha/beta hydrolase [Shimia sp. R9_1]MBO9407856.1 alpha/beta hydrolase [Shimia sp. R9_1]